MCGWQYVYLSTFDDVLLYFLADLPLASSIHPSIPFFPWRPLHCLPSGTAHLLKVLICQSANNQEQESELILFWE
jgi:hypothetical protein